MSGTFDTVLGPVDDSSLLILIEEAVALISFVLIMILFWWTFLSFQNSGTTIASGHKLKYLCLLSLSSFFFMSFISAMLINDLVTQHLTLGMCQVIYPLYFIFYNIGKISIYCLVSFRQQLIFNQSLYSQKNLSISPITSNIYRLFSILIPSFLWAILIYLGFPHIEIITIPNPGENNQDYKYCYMRVFDDVIYAQFTLAMIGICDTIFRLITLSIFITKSIKVTTYYKKHINTQKRDIIVKLSKLMRKTNLLDITSIITTLLFLICAAYVFQQFIFFLIIDAVICSCCTIGLFQFGNKLYATTCFKCEPYCICLYCLERNLQKHGKRRKGFEYEAFDDGNVSSVHLKETGTSTPNTPRDHKSHSLQNGVGIVQNGNNAPHTPKDAKEENSAHKEVKKMDLNKTNPSDGGVETTVDTANLHTTMSDGLLHIGIGGDGKRKTSAVTMLSGYENVEPKDLDITSERLIEDRNNSLLSVSEFL